MTTESNKQNIILFGPPGVGKSAIGAIFRDEFGFDFYEGDDEMTQEERKLVSLGQWGDANRRILLTRMGDTIKHLHSQSKSGLVTSVALTRQWMRDFLNDQTGGFLRFVLVVSSLQMEELEALVSKRRESGHAITVESFRKFTADFEPPTMEHLVLKNPHVESKSLELITNVRNVIDQLRLTYG